MLSCGCLVASYGIYVVLGVPGLWKVVCAYLTSHHQIHVMPNLIQVDPAKLMKKIIGLAALLTLRHQPTQKSPAYTAETSLMTNAGELSISLLGHSWQRQHGSDELMCTRVCRMSVPSFLYICMAGEAGWLCVMLCS